MRTQYIFVIISHLFMVSFFCLCVSLPTDALVVGQVMRNWEYLQSSNKLFKLRFFSGQASSGQYLGIERVNYKEFDFFGDHQMKLVWVANRGNPLPDTSGFLNITDDGNLVLTNHNGTFITLNTEQPATSSNTTLTLLDTGNLVLKTDERIVWQSFDFPSDKWLPGMKLGWFNLVTGKPHHAFLTSYLAPTITNLGAFTLGVDPNSKEQLGIWQRGALIWQSGTWNGYNFSYFPDIGDLSDLSFRYFSDENQSYFTYTRTKNNIHTWIEMGFSGTITLHSIDGGVNIESNMNSCEGLEGQYASEGCTTGSPSNCSSGNSFKKISGSMDSWFSDGNSSLGISDCKEMCTRDCSCTAFSSTSSDGIGCKFSSGKMTDYQQDTFYIRNSSFAGKDHPSNNTLPDNSGKRRLWLSIGAPAFSVPVLVAVTFLLYKWWRTQNSAARKDEFTQLGNTEILELNGKMEHELPFLDFSTVEAATSLFSDSSKIGQGGFGPVYKGKMANGQEIAVKRLSKSSGQGFEEFKTEVLLISKLQHRNLVRLLGFSIQGVERILIYEYLPNKSLDSFLFDAEKRALLDWKLRFCIIEGIAQGLLYLHKYSRLKIIHRDLKTSNILLDNNMNPKISDFGTARVFGENESRANTKRIIGTYGYMSPEYAMDGLFSVKSDVYSFGVMMLEILSGKRNAMDFCRSGRSLNLLGYAWELWKEGQEVELMDTLPAETCSTSEVRRRVHIALLCVQESAADRPTMSDVLFMLTNETTALSTPNKPAFSATVSDYNDAISGNLQPSSGNVLTISDVAAR